MVITVSLSSFHSSCLHLRNKCSFFLVAFSVLAVDWDSDTRRLLFDEQEAQVVVYSFLK